MQSLNLGHLIIAFNVLGILGILILLIAYLREKKSKENSEKTIVKEQKHSSENPNSKKANHKKDLEELDQLLKSETPREEIHSEDFSTQNLEIEILSEKIIDEIEIKDESEEVFLDLSQNNETTEEENNENRAKGKDDEESEQEYEEKERTYTLSLHIAPYASIEIIPEDRMENLVIYLGPNFIRTSEGQIVIVGVSFLIINPSDATERSIKNLTTGLINSDSTLEKKINITSLIIENRENSEEISSEEEVEYLLKDLIGDADELERIVEDSYDCAFKKIFISNIDFNDQSITLEITFNLTV